MSETSVDGIAEALGRPIVPPETLQVQRWVDRVENRVRRGVKDLEEWLEDDLYRDTFTGIVEDVVIRRINNPEGLRSERIDDYYYDRGDNKADLWPTEAEWAELMPASSSAAFSTRPGFEPGWKRWHRW